MPNLSTCWLDAKTLEDGDSMALTEALDLGEYRTAEIVVNVESADEGGGATLVLQHAARNVNGAYLDFETPVSVALSATGATWVKVDRFTRFLGWSISGSLGGAVVVSVDVVGKR